MVEVRFKPADVGSVTDGSVTEVKLADGAVTDIKVDTIMITKVTGGIDGRAAATTGDKGITALGWDTMTDEVVLDREE